MKYLIVANGKIESFSFYKDIIKKADIVVAVDGGTNHLFKMKISPDVIIGDLDSIDTSVKKYYEKKSVKFMAFPPKKDFTDTELALDYVSKLNPTSITFIGVLGERIDHSFANILLLKKVCDLKIPAKIIDEKNEIYFLKDKSSIQIEGKKGDFLSIVPLSEKVEEISLKGLKYPLLKTNLELASTKGISNVFKKSKATIKIKKGLMLVIRSKD